MEKKGKASTRAKNKYNAKAYDRIHLMVPKGTKDMILEMAKKRSETINGFLNRIIKEEFKREDGSEK